MIVEMIGALCNQYARVTLYEKQNGILPYGHPLSYCPSPTGPYFEEETRIVALSNFSVGLTLYNLPVLEYT